MPEVPRAALRRLQALVPRRRGRTWILGYHLVGGGSGLPIDLPRERFAAHLEMLSERTQVIGLGQAVSELREGRPPHDTGPTRVVLTFDDAFLNFHEVILPLLAERRFPATLFVPPGFVNGDGNHPLYHAHFAGLRPMTWELLREAVGAGVEIGSHSYRHTNLTRLAPAVLAEDLGRAQAEIEHRLHVSPAAVCYPEGFANTHVAHTAAHFHACGVVGGGRPLRPSARDDLLRLPRLPMRADMTATMLAGLLEQPVCLEEWTAERARQLRGRVVQRA